MPIDWEAILTVRYRKPGASDREIAQLQNDLALPMSSDEIARVQSTNRNPYRPEHPRYSQWKPFDPTGWLLPNKPLSLQYVELLRWSNGGGFHFGNRLIQLYATHEVRPEAIGANTPLYVPGFLPIGMDGGGNMWTLDMRNPPVDGEYPVTLFDAGVLDVDEPLLEAPDLVTLFTSSN